MFKEEDLRYITARGSDVKTVEEQLRRFKKGFPWLDIDRKSVV